MKEREDNLDRLFKGYYKSTRPKRRQDSELFECDRLEAPVCGDRAPDHCPDTAAVDTYKDGGLDEAEAGTISVHLKGCKKCREKADAATAALEDMRENRLDKTPDNLKTPPEKK